MELPPIWFDARGIETGRTKSLTRTLADAGIELRPLGTSPPRGPGLVCFERVTADLCRRLHETSTPGCERILAIAIGPPPRADDNWRLLAAGASDVLVFERGAGTAEAVRARLERWRAIDDLVGSPVVRDHLVGGSPAWIAVLRQAVEAARFSDSAVLITGATGTGKELVARLIHTLDRRRDKGELVIVDCTTITPELAGSELFGHEKGAFTSAVAERQGAFALADGGTVFLDEVGELPPRLQAELLRVIQERSYKRVGGNAWRRTDFRLVCATNRDLAAEIARGAFRRDLFYRIASTRLALPTLGARRTDVVPLARHFLAEAFGDREPPDLDPAVRDYLTARDYPGNVRNLRRVVLQMAHRHVGPGPISPGDLPEGERPRPEDPGEEWRDEGFERAVRRALARGLGLKEISSAAAEAAVDIALADSEGNLQQAAGRLQVTDRALQMRRAARRQRPEPGG
jgi:transcriptional regulator with GAF, ATPase, and Fis domain